MLFTFKYLQRTLYFVISVFFVSLFLCSCTTTPVNEMPAEEGIEKIRAEHANKEWREVIANVDLFRTRYPYSAFTLEAELLQADAYFKQEEYSDAIASYEDFLRRNPHNENASLAIFRIARCLDLQSPEDSDREQVKSYRAMDKYKHFLALFPDSPWAQTAQERIAALRSRLLEHDLFIAHFYLKKEQYSAAISRAEKVIKQYKEDKAALAKARRIIATSYLELAQELEQNPESKKSIYFLDNTPAQLREKAKLYLN